MNIYYMSRDIKNKIVNTACLLITIIFMSVPQMIFADGNDIYSQFNSAVDKHSTDISNNNSEQVTSTAIGAAIGATPGALLLLQVLSCAAAGPIGAAVCAPFIAPAAALTAVGGVAGGAVGYNANPSGSYRKVNAPVSVFDAVSDPASRDDSIDEIDVDNSASNFESTPEKSNLQKTYAVATPVSKYENPNPGPSTTVTSSIIPDTTDKTKSINAYNFFPGDEKLFKSLKSAVGFLSSDDS